MTLNKGFVNYYSRPVTEQDYCRAALAVEGGGEGGARSESEVIEAVIAPIVARR
jgi:hypothetical protein